MTYRSRARLALTTGAAGLTALIAACGSGRSSAAPSPSVSSSPPAITSSAFPPAWRFKPGVPATFAEHAMVVEHVARRRARRASRS